MTDSHDPCPGLIHTCHSLVSQQESRSYDGSFYLAPNQAVSQNRRNKSLSLGQSEVLQVCGIQSLGRGRMGSRRLPI